MAVLSTDAAADTPIHTRKKPRTKAWIMLSYLTICGMAGMLILRSSSLSVGGPGFNIGDWPDPSHFSVEALMNSPLLQQPKQEEEPKQKKPLNIVLFYADDWRHDSVGYASNGLVHTPFIDSLAQRGITFLYNCVTTSICWISRATLYTGQYLSRHNTSMPSEPNFYQYWNESFVHLLRSAGYWVGHVGKWHFEWAPNMTYQWDFGRPYYGFHWQGKLHITDRNERDGLKFLTDRPKDQPFFLSVCFFAPHAVDHKAEQYFPQAFSEEYYENVTIPTAPSAHDVGWQGMPDFIRSSGGLNEGRRRYKLRFGVDNDTQYQDRMKKYYRLISEVDMAVKELVETLETEGILNETLVIFTTDNGLFHAEHGIAGKWFPHQESIRVPLVILDPRMKDADAGSKRNEFTLSIDLATTILGAANLEPASRMQGRDIADLYLEQSDNNESWREEFYYEHPMHLNTKVIPGSTALVRKDFKYMKWTDYGKEQLFDLLNDPYEMNDLFGVEKHTELLKEMRARHDELEQEVK